MARPAVRRPTSFDIAALAGVSQPTVSRALNGSPTVSAETRARVTEAALKLGYRVDRHASALRRQTSNTLALLLFEDPTPDDSHINPFFTAMLGSATRAAAAKGYDILTSFQQLSSDWHRDYADSRRADGIIFLGYGDWREFRPRLDELVAQGTAYAFWGAAERGAGWHCVGSDNEGGGYVATRHLIARGRRRIAFLGERGPGCPELDARWRGHCTALAESGLAADAELARDCTFTEQAGHDAMRDLLDRGLVFDAVFAASDLMAIGAMRALGEAGRTVPGDVAVVGFDDVPAAALTSPPLTTVAQNAGEAGRALVDLLTEQLAGAQPEPRVLPVQLVVRASS
jgi:DNA-binding LacI/PurR family transcriptional regulator